MVLFRVWLNGSWFWIHEEVLNFHNWILYYHELFHDNRNKNQQIYQWICYIQITWKLSYLNLQRIVIFKLFEHRTMLILFLFLLLIISIWFTIKPNNLTKIYSWILEEHDRTSIFANGSYKISRVCLSISLSVHQSMKHFSQDLHSGFY